MSMTFLARAHQEAARAALPVLSATEISQSVKSINAMVQSIDANWSISYTDGDPSVGVYQVVPLGEGTRIKDHGVIFFGSDPKMTVMEFQDMISKGILNKMGDEKQAFLAKLAPIGPFGCKL